MFPFLVMEDDLAEARGIGEKLTPLEPLEGLHWIIAFPAWKSETALAYSKLDIYRQMHNINVNEEDFSYEALEILRKLRKKERAGLLPNDFLVLLSHDHPEYEGLFQLPIKLALWHGDFAEAAVQFLLYAMITCHLTH